MAKDETSLFSQLLNFGYGSVCTLVIPGALFLVSATLVAYQGVTEKKTDIPMSGFLANIMLQMIPLIALKIKIWLATDRVSLVPLVLCKTLMIHATLEAIRIVSTLMRGGEFNPKLPLYVDTFGLCLSLAVLKWEFECPLNPLVWVQHLDVRNLVVLACGAAMVTEVGFAFLPESWMDESTRQYFKDPLDPSTVMFTAANYIDIVAFMPIVWRLYQAENEHEDKAVGTAVSGKAKRQVNFFFLFVIVFYGWDDVIFAIMELRDVPVALMAHAAHFMLLLDFAGFFTFQVTQPKENVTELGMEAGEQLQGLLAPDEDDHY